MTRTEVHKFGGTSVTGAARMEAVAALVAETASRTRLVVVASAMAKVTDTLVEAAAAAGRGELDRALEAIALLRLRHEETLTDLGGLGDAATGAESDAGAHRAGSALLELRRLLDELEALLRAVAHLGELTPRARDRILATGEKLSIRLLALAIRRRGLAAVALDADTFLETDDHFGEASALTGIADHTVVAALEPRLRAGEIPVVTGFTGRAPDGSTTTLGRGGSDLTATLLAAALKADEVTIWTDVDGVFTTDPRIVPEARLIRQLNYREATEMSYYGAKVLHQRTIIPVAKLGIPVWIRNSLAPDHPATVVDGRYTPGSHPVKSISAIRGHALVSIEGKGMAGVPGVAARVFRSLASRHISVTMISQSSSEASICLAVPAEHAVAAEMALKQEFRADITHGDVEEIVVRRDTGLVAAVGLGMAHTPGVAARVFSALGRRGINILAIAQGSSELNISLAVDRDRVDDAVRAIHHEFGLHRQDTGLDTGEGFDLLLLGCGQIGRTLVELVLDRHAHLFERFGLKARIVALADRSGFLFAPTGLSQGALTGALEAKAAGRPLRSLEGGRKADRPLELVRHALGWRLARPVLVDVSDADGNAEVFLEAMRLGCDVVTANKKPLAGPMEAFQALLNQASSLGRLLRAEATVGAGLPVVDTLEQLIATGDRLTAAHGCLSGTLGYLTSALEDGVPLSQAVAEAARLGYTEPDPVADLSGADVARKAVILGRLSGLATAETPVRCEGLVDPGLAGLELEELLARLKAYDAPLAERVARARETGHVLRYMARIDASGIEVGLREVPKGSTLGALKGSDNLIMFESERYKTRPLVVIGPGAGAEVTAMGVLSDILRIAAERR